MAEDDLKLITIYSFIDTFKYLDVFEKINFSFSIIDNYIENQNPSDNVAEKLESRLFSLLYTFSEYETLSERVSQFCKFYSIPIEDTLMENGLKASSKSFKLEIIMNVLENLLWKRKYGDYMLLDNAAHQSRPIAVLKSFSYFLFKDSAKDMRIIKWKVFEKKETLYVLCRNRHTLKRFIYALWNEVFEDKDEELNRKMLLVCSEAALRDLKEHGTLEEKQPMKSSKNEYASDNDTTDPTFTLGPDDVDSEEEAVKTNMKKLTQNKAEKKESQNIVTKKMMDSLIQKKLTNYFKNKKFNRKNTGLPNAKTKYPPKKVKAPLQKSKSLRNQTFTIQADRNGAKKPFNYAKYIPTTQNLHFVLRGRPNERVSSHRSMANYSNTFVLSSNKNRTNNPNTFLMSSNKNMPYDRRRHPNIKSSLPSSKSTFTSFKKTSNQNKPKYTLGNVYTGSSSAYSQDVYEGYENDHYNDTNNFCGTYHNGKYHNTIENNYQVEDYYDESYYNGEENCYDEYQDGYNDEENCYNGVETCYNNEEGYDVDKNGYDVDKSCYDVDENGYDVDKSCYDVDENGYDVDKSCYDVDENNYNSVKNDYNNIRDNYGDEEEAYPDYDKTYRNEYNKLFIPNAQHSNATDGCEDVISCDSEGSNNEDCFVVELID